MWGVRRGGRIWVRLITLLGTGILEVAKAGEANFDKTK